jgi:nucleoside phosphorylase
MSYFRLIKLHHHKSFAFIKGPCKNKFGDYGAGILPAGEARATSISCQWICKERATRPAVKRPSQNCRSCICTVPKAVFACLLAFAVFGPGCATQVTVPAEWGEYQEQLFARETADGWDAGRSGGEFPNYGMMFPRSVKVTRRDGPVDQPEPRFWFSADPEGIKTARRIANRVKLSRSTDDGQSLSAEPQVIVGGKGVSGPTFVDNAAYRQWVWQTFQADALDMETAAVAQVAYVNQVPFIAFRSLSDLAGGGGGKNESSVFFKLAADNSAAVVLAMAYIMIVNPAILEAAGIPKGPSTTATILSAAFGTLVMGFYARRPFAIAPYMGENAFIAFTVVKVLGFSWQIALGAIFVAGVLFTVLTLLRVRGWMANAIPLSLKYSFAVGIGLFLTFIGLNETGIVTLGVKDAPVSLGAITEPPALLAIGGFLLIVWLMVKGVRGAILIGILTVTLVSFFFGLVPIPRSIIALPPNPAPILCQLDILGALTPKAALLTTSEWG